MTQELLYLFGEPGAGKSSLMSHLTRRLTVTPYQHPFQHRLYTTAGVYELGPRGHGSFPGTDGLSMSVQPTVVNWLRQQQPSFVIGEGDRLANGSFFEAARDLGYSLRLVHLKGEHAAALHRSIRNTNQNAGWVAGRRTKCFNLADEWWPLELPAGAPMSVLEGHIAAQDWPIYEALKEARDK